MGSVRGFRCASCRGELLATPEPGLQASRPGWTPPVLCCGQALRPLDPDEIVPAMLTRGRVSRCPRCGYQVRIVVHSVNPPVCMLCQQEFALRESGQGERDGAALAAATRR